MKKKKERKRKKQENRSSSLEIVGSKFERLKERKSSGEKRTKNKNDEHASLTVFSVHLTPATLRSTIRDQSYFLTSKTNSAFPQFCRFGAQRKSVRQRHWLARSQYETPYRGTVFVRSRFTLDSPPPCCPLLPPSADSVPSGTPLVSFSRFPSLPFRSADYPGTRLGPTMPRGCEGRAYR